LAFAFAGSNPAPCTIIPMTDISSQISKLKELLDKSNRILITSHISPDPDSVSSMLLLGTTLELNYPDKQINMVSEELPEDLEFMAGYEKLRKQPLAEAVQATDLVFIVDAMHFGRCTRTNAEEVSKYVKERAIPVVVLDHHEPVGVEENVLYFNQGYPAAVQEVYEVLYHELDLRRPEGYAETTMTGLYSDTGGFAYLNDSYKDTLTLIGELLDTGVKIELIRNKLNQYTEDQMKVVGELAQNLTNESGYSYSYISDEFVNKWLESGKEGRSLNVGSKIFLNNFIRNIAGRPWGFVTFRDPLLEDSYFSVSLRSVGGKPDVSQIAGKLNGGGHKAASGGKVQASSVDEAITKIKEAIGS
jgi:phosphoesterase RecJ-like protein